MEYRRMSEEMSSQEVHLLMKVLILEASICTATYVEHRSMYSYVRLEHHRCTATYVSIDRCTASTS